MADRYWVGGTGNWNATSTANWATSSGGASGASAPTSADNVIFDAGSDAGGIFTVTVTGTTAAPALCADFTASALDFAMTLTMGATAFLDVYGSMTLPATNFSVSGTAGAGIRYKSTTTGKTLTTNGVSLGNVAITFDGVGGGWTLGSAYTSTQLITLTNGTFNTGNYNVTSTGVSSSNSNTRTLTLGSATLTLSGTTPITFTTATNLTLNADTSQITCSAASPTFAGGGLTFYNVTFTNNAAGTASITGTNTFNNLTFTSIAISGNRNISLAANQTIKGTLTLGTANIAINRMFMRSDVIGVARTITAATVATLADVDFRDIVGAGVGTWTGTRLGNCSGNTGITFDAGKNVYCVSAVNANWASNVWALTSGGAVAVNNFPLAQDTVIFDSNSTLTNMAFNGSAGFNIGTINFSGLTTALTFNQNNGGISVYGNLILSGNVTFSGVQNIVLIKNSGTQTITSAGCTITNPIIFAGPNNATLQLQDALTISNEFLLEEGTLSLNGFNLTCTRFTFTTTRTRSIAFGTNKIVLTANATSVIGAANLTGFSYTGTPRIESNYSGSAGTRLFDIGRAGGATESNVFDLYITAGSDIVDLRNTGQSYYRNLDFTGFSGSTSANQSLNIYGDLTYSSGMTVSAGNGISFLKSSGTQTVTSNGKTIDFPITKSAASTLQFADSLTMGSSKAFTFSNGTVLLKNGVTSTVGTFVTSGSTQKFLASTLAGSQATLSQASGTVNATFLTIKDSSATGGATWNALWSNNNVDEGNNSGWIFGDPPVTIATEYTYQLRSFTQPRRF
jgi:hypothetical protein